MDNMVSVERVDLSILETAAIDQPPRRSCVTGDFGATVPADGRMGPASRGHLAGRVLHAGCPRLDDPGRARRSVPDGSFNGRLLRQALHVSRHGRGFYTERVGTLHSN